jgi:hypothetical protein
MSVIRLGAHQVTCNKCGAEGLVRVVRQRGDDVRVEDSLDHAEDCPVRPRTQPRHLRKKRWVKQEKRANALVGARETLASGAVGMDGDGRAFHAWRVESKQTEKDFYLLRQDTWTKLVKGALTSGEEPVLHVEFQRSHGWTLRFVVIRKDLYEALTDDPWHIAAWCKNPKSFRLHHAERTPLLVDLEPTGVMVGEAVFEALKEKL